MVICPDWNEVKLLDLERVRGVMARAVVVDGRNIYPPDKLRSLGFEYYPMGRPTSLGEPELETPHPAPEDELVAARRGAPAAA